MRAAASHENASLTSAPHTPNRGRRTEAKALRASQGQPQPSTLPLRGWSDRRTKGVRPVASSCTPRDIPGRSCRPPAGIVSAFAPLCATARRAARFAAILSSDPLRAARAQGILRAASAQGIRRATVRAGPALRSRRGKHVHLGVETRPEWADEATDMGRSRAYEPASERHRPRPAFVNRTACRVPDSAPGRSPVPIRPPEGGRSAIDR